MRRTTCSVAIAFSLAAGCGGGGGGDGTTPPPTSGPPASVTVTISATTLVIGDSLRPTATVRDAQGNVLSAAVSWRASAPNILAVNPATGVARALALDTASIIATVTGAAAAPSGSARLTVRPPATATVGMLPQSFVPVSLVLAVGGTVTYDFTGSTDHNVLFPKRPNGQPLVPGSPADILPMRNVRVQRTFGTAGTFPYDCTIHPGMSGEIIVVP